MKSAKPRLL